MNKLIEVRNLSVGYDSKPRVLQHVSLDVFEHDFLGIIGPNGGGKTTLLKAILGLITPAEGVIRFFEDGKPVNRLNIGYLPQINHIDKKFPISVSDVIQSGLTPQKLLFSRYTKHDKTKVHEIACRLGVDNLLSRAIGELSGGQLQRVLLGRAIVDNPRVLILDEPNSYVDKRFETNFYKILQKINHQIAIMLVSHDVGTILSHVKNIACVNAHVHYHAGTTISSDWLQTAYAGCPIEIIGHGDLPHRVLKKHAHCDCEN